MSNLHEKAAGKRTAKRQPLASSPGIDSRSVTAKDVAPDEAAAKDRVTRNTTSPDPDEREEALLDDAVDLTFPASDPIATLVPDNDAEKSRGSRP
jgi:hypothetical protein